MPAVIGRLRDFMFARFLTVGVVNVIVDVSVFNALLAAAPSQDLGLVLAINTVSFSIANINSYLLNTRYTFRVQRAWGAFARFFAVGVGGVIVYSISLGAAVAVFEPRGTLQLNIAKMATIVFPLAWNFVGYRYFALRGSPALEEAPPDR